MVACVNMKLLKSTSGCSAASNKLQYVKADLAENDEIEKETMRYLRGLSNNRQRSI